MSVDCLAPSDALSASTVSSWASRSTADTSTAAHAAIVMPAADVVAAPAAVAGAAACAPLPSGPVALPLRLPRPPGLRAVDPASLDLDVELRAVPPSYLVDRLRQWGPRLLLATAHTRMLLADDAATGTVPLPSHVVCETTMPATAAAAEGAREGDTDDADDADAVHPPTHILAIHGTDVSDTLLLPVHGLVYALGCARLAYLSRSRPADDGSGSLPLCHLHVPNAQAMPLIHAWLAARDGTALLSRLLPASAVRPKGKPAAAAPAEPRITAAAIAERVARGSSQADIGAAIRLVHGLWADLCALQIADQALWDHVQLAWGILVGAMALANSLHPPPAPPAPPLPAA